MHTLCFAPNVLYFLRERKAHDYSIKYTNPTLDLIKKRNYTGVFFWPQVNEEM